MPIRILSLPSADLQYTLNCMDICDLIAFSLCSNRTKHLVKSSKRKIEYIDTEFGSHSSIIIKPPTDEFIFFEFDDSWIELARRNGVEVFRKPKFTHRDWVDHFLNIFNESMINELSIEDVDVSYLDTVKETISKCNRLEITNDCSHDVAKIAFSKLSPIAVDTVALQKNIFDNESDISKLLSLNLESAYLDDHRKPFEIKLEDLLVLNITELMIEIANISEQELNRFLKLWMKGNHGFYRPKVIMLFLEDGREINHDKVFEGINHEAFRLNRTDGKELIISTHGNVFILRFDIKYE
ncbi:hypothetical protein B9Z55_021585 [Caenorhabditis nigoni]|nr:hypothetical protein B9Z55_021585 [Caenorhabditis nigoni]